MFFGLAGFVLNLLRHRLVENHDRRRFLASPDVSAKTLGLLVRDPERRLIAASDGSHREEKRVDTTIGLRAGEVPGDAILALLPRTLPRDSAFFESGNNPLIYNLINVHFLISFSFAPFTGRRFGSQESD